jgi:L-alanine-DL-glutamate epimerase-like enolase superfamily enzyme
MKPVADVGAEPKDDAPLALEAAIETWPIAGEFVIARGARREATVVVARISDGKISGRGEAVPYARYGETPEGVLEAIRACRDLRDRASLARTLAAGAARNALDCALWDYEAKRVGTTAAALAGLPAPRPVTTAYTIGLAEPNEMAAKAAAVPSMPLLKVKLGGVGDEERMRKVRAARPDARLIGDANESWPLDRLPELMQVAAELGFELIEQPVPAHQDALLAGLPHPVPLCADESAHTRQDLDRLAGRYEAINIKLDKTGGLSEALAFAEEARSKGFKILAGCMLATSLAMAPALLIAQSADWVDLDGPLLLARDREPALLYEGALIHPPHPGLWG